jgi:hypothetical protein
MVPSVECGVRAMTYTSYSVGRPIDLDDLETAPSAAVAAVGDAIAPDVTASVFTRATLCRYPDVTGNPNRH